MKERVVASPTPNYWQLQSWNCAHWWHGVFDCIRVHLNLKPDVASTCFHSIRAFRGDMKMRERGRKSSSCDTLERRLLL
jgi:hypothetical protein